MHVHKLWLKSPFKARFFEPLLPSTTLIPIPWQLHCNYPPTLSYKMIPRNDTSSVITEDVLLSIFGLCIKRDTRAALELSHVCRRWRALCLDSSMLWSNIRVVNSYATSTALASSASDAEGMEPQVTSSCKPDYQQLRSYLTRSKNRLLDLVVRIRMPRHLAKGDESWREHDKVDYTEFHCKTKLIALLISKHSYRIRSLKIKTDNYNGASIFFSRAFGDPRTDSTTNSAVVLNMKPELLEDELNRKWGRLENLRVKWTGSPRDYEKMSTALRNQFMVFLLKSSASVHTLTLAPAAPLPRLKSLTIRGLAIDWDFFGPTTLEELDISYLHYAVQPTYEQLRAILIKNSATLKALSLMDICQYFAVLPDEDGTTLYFDLPVLRSLTLAYVDPFDLLPFVAYSRLPSLKKLVVANLGQRRFEIITPESTPDEVELEYFAYTRVVLSKIAESWDISALTAITLYDVQLIFDNVTPPPNPVTHLDTIEGLFEKKGEPIWASGIAGWDHDANKLIPFEFWQQCVSLTHLTLARPDPLTLYALYCPAPAFMSIPRHRREEGLDPKDYDLPEGMWLTGPTTGTLLTLPIPNFRELILSGVPKDMGDEFVERRKALWERCLQESDGRVYDLADCIKVVDAWL